MPTLQETMDLSRGVKRFVYTQDTASDTWTIVHNLNSLSIVTDAITVHSGGDEKIIPYSVNVVDANTIIVSWTMPRTGSVRIS